MIYLTRLIIGIISAIGILFLLAAYIKIFFGRKIHYRSELGQVEIIQLKEQNSREHFAHNMILAIALSDLINCIATFILTKPYLPHEKESANEYLCFAQAFLYTFSEIATVSLTTAFSFSLYLGSKDFKFKYVVLYLAYGIVPSLIISVLPFPGILNIYG